MEHRGMKKRQPKESWPVLMRQEIYLGKDEVILSRSDGILVY